ncbi:MAG: amidohydrolase [Beijerinckiaceae bacterium]
MTGQNARQPPVALPFDPNPRPPSWKLPANSCDTHIHVFGPPNIFPYAADRRYEPPAAPVEYYFAMQKITGLERAIAVQPTAHGTDNSAILDAIAKAGGRMKGIANIDENTTDRELARLKAGGVVGARFSLMADRAGSQSAIEHALPRMQELGWVLNLHVDPENFLAHEKFIRSLTLPVVIDHMARCDPRKGVNQPAFRFLLDLLQQDNFWTKICSISKLTANPQASRQGTIPYADMIPLAEAVVAAAPARTVWGSDWPHGNTFDLGTVPNDGVLLDFLGAAVPDDALRHAILVSNPARFFGFD